MTQEIEKLLEELEAGLESLPDGPWAYEAHGVTGNYGVGVICDANGNQVSGFSEDFTLEISKTIAVKVNGGPLAAHIARCSPDNIRKLIAAIKSRPRPSEEAVEALWQDLLDKDDRTSGADYPDMALITFAEFRDYLSAIPGGVSEAANDVLAERRRQIEAEGWTPAHDDEHTNNELATVAACYAVPPAIRNDFLKPSSFADDAKWYPNFWPASWGKNWWKPTDRRRDLVKAGALIIAEIERLDRLPALAPRTGRGDPSIFYDAEGRN